MTIRNVFILQKPCFVPYPICNSL